MKYFTEREFSGIFSLAGGNFESSKREFPVALIIVLHSAHFAFFYLAGEGNLTTDHFPRPLLVSLNR